MTTFGPKVTERAILPNVPNIPLKFTENTVGYRIYVAHLSSQSFRNAIIRFAISPARMSVLLSPLMEKDYSQCKNFREISYWRLFIKIRRPLASLVKIGRKLWPLLEDRKPGQCSWYSASTRARRFGVRTPVGQGTVSLLHARPDQTWGPTSHPCNVYQGRNNLGIL